MAVQSGCYTTDAPDPALVAEASARVEVMMAVGFDDGDHPSTRITMNVVDVLSGTLPSTFDLIVPHGQIAEF